MDNFLTHDGPPRPPDYTHHVSIYPEDWEPVGGINISNVFIDDFFNISIALKERKALTIKEIYDMDNEQLKELLQLIQNQPSSDQQVMLVLLINNILMDRRLSALEKN